MDKIKVGIFGYGTIGKRVADAVLLQDDMELAGVTGNSYNYRIEAANEKKLPIFKAGEGDELESNGISCQGNVQDFLNACDIVVDCTPKKIGMEHKEKYYIPNKKKAIFQGGEKPTVGDISFVAQCNYKDAINKDYIRVVSCNTTGLCRALQTVDQLCGVDMVHATMIRRGADPWDIRHGPINAIVPVLEMPSHHGPDVNTVLPNIKIFTTAISVSTTLMHAHSVHVNLKKEPDIDELIESLKNTTRIRIVRNAEKVRSTAEIMELAKDLGRPRGDMPELSLWQEAIGNVGKNLFYVQAVHQESIVVPENIDAIRAAMGFEDAQVSIDKTNKTLNVK
ncbi:type II glyceraldehyde-3-phosphate dehydrogenase [Nanoarchaeota archaeon]